MMLLSNVVAPDVEQVNTRELFMADAQINDACEQFRESWKHATLACIDQSLRRASDELRPRLLKELICEEIELFRKYLDKAQYASRLPQCGSTVDEAFGSVVTIDQPAVASSAGLNARVPFSTSFADRFKILSDRAAPLGKGGMGTVLLAKDQDLEREVAVKVKLPSRPDGDELVARARFDLEATITAGLEHQSILPVFAIGSLDGEPAYAMRRVKSNETLETRVREFHSVAHGTRRQSAQQVLELRRLVRHVIDICSVIAHAHERDIIHRDLKPKNVMIGENGETYVVDWGLAKNIKHRHGQEHGPEVGKCQVSDDSLTVVGTVLGTRHYMSPEQAQGKPATFASDIYSIGATLYYVLSGNPPSSESSQEDKLGALSDEVQLADLIAVCRMAMAQGVEQRYETANALKSDLELWLADQPVKARTTGNGRPYTVWENAARSLRHHSLRFTAYGLTAASIVFALFGGLYYFKYRDADEQRSIAKGALAGEQSARAREQQLAEQVEQLGYLRQISVALSMWRENRLEQARELLQACPKKLRNWEWHYVNRLCEQGGREFKHKSTVRQVAIAAAKDKVVTSDDRSVQLWSLKSGMPTATIEVPPNSVQALQFAPGGESFFAWLEREPRTQLVTWRTQDGSQISAVELAPPEGEKIRGISHDAKRYVSRQIRTPGTVSIRECSTNDALATFTPRSVGGVSWLGGDKLLNWGIVDGRVQVFSGSDGAEVCLLENRFNGISAAGGNDRFAVLGFNEGTVSVWDIRTGKEIWTVKIGNQMIRAIAVSEGDQFVVGAVGGGVKVFDARLKKEVFDFPHHTDTILSVAITPDGRQFVSGGLDKLACVMDTQGDVIRAHKRWGLRLTMFPDGKRFMTSSSVEPTVHVWETQSLAKARESLQPGRTNVTVVGPDNKTLYVGGVDGNVHVLDVAGVQRHKPLGPGPNEMALADLVILDERKLLLAAYHNNPSVVWDLRTGAMLRQIPEAQRLARNANGDRLALVAGANVEVLNTDDWSSVNKWSDADLSEAVAFVPDGNRLATGGRRHIKVWESNSGKLVQTLNGHFGNITCLRALPDGKRLISGSEDKTIRLWDLILGEEVMIIGTHDSAINDLAVSPDGSQLFSASEDGVVKRWQASSDSVGKAP